MSSHDAASVEWRGVGLCIVKKPGGMQVILPNELDARTSSEPSKPSSGQASKGKGKKNGTGNSATSGSKGGKKGGAASATSDANLSVCAWTAKQLEGGIWNPETTSSTAASGLVLLSRPEAEVPAEIRGSCVILAVPTVDPKDRGWKACLDDLQGELELWGGPGDEARILESVPSGHFGSMAVIEMDVPLGGERAVWPLDAVLAVQEMGWSVVQKLPDRTRSVHDPRSKPQERGQTDDIVAGTCFQISAIRLPRGVETHIASRQKPNKSGRVSLQPALPQKWSSFMAAEESLAKQSEQSKDGLVEFYGLSFFVPSEQLKPRVSSGSIVDAALKVLKQMESEGNLKKNSEVHVMDLGVGCGALLLSTLHALGSQSHGVGIDIDDDAVRICEENATRLLSSDHRGQVKAICSDFAQLDLPKVREQLSATGYDVIVCNPPYRSIEQQEAYASASGSHGGYTEDVKTLVAGETGLEMYEAIAQCITRDLQNSKKENRKPILRSQGSLIFQVEAGSFGRCGGMAAKVGGAVQRASQNVLKVMEVHLDAKGLERAIILRSTLPS